MKRLLASGLIFGLFLWAGVAQAATINVPLDQPTIQAAVNAASTSSPDTINVSPGVYPEHVVIDRPVIIHGANAGVNGNGTRGAESIVDGTDTDAPFAIRSDGVTIDGLEIMNGSNGAYFSGIWTETNHQNVNIINNIITHNGFGIWAECGGTCLIEHNLFDGNNETNSPGTASISADATTGLTINANEFKNDTAGNPILLQATAPDAHNNITISNNSFHNNSGATVMYVLGVTGGTFTGNNILPAPDVTGISFSGADKNITVTNNTISGSARGIRIEDAGYYGGAGGNSNISITNNSLFGNTEYAVGNISGYATTTDATHNWWGNATGPLATTTPVTNPSGTGDTVFGNVAFIPWFTDAARTTLNTDVVPPPPQATSTPPATSGNVDGHRQDVSNLLGNNGGTGAPTGGAVLGAFTTADNQVQITAVKNQLISLISQLIAILQAQLAAQGGVTFTHDLTIGSKGSEVVALQQILVAKGYLVVPSSYGYFGSLTKAAVAKWQAAVGISPATGYFGPKSRAVLNAGGGH